MPKRISPTTAVSRALRDLGLKPGLDFRIRGAYVNGERVRTVATIFGVNACAVVRFHYDAVEASTAALGHRFRVRDYGPADVTIQN